MKVKSALSLNVKLERLSVLIGEKLEFDWTNHQPRVVAKGGSQDISPRLTRSEMLLWLDAAITVADMMTRKAA